MAFTEEKMAELRMDAINWVQEDGMALGQVISAFTKDPEIALAAIENAEGAYIYAAASLKADRQFNLDALSRQPNCLERMDGFKADPDFMMEAVNIRGICLKHATKDIQGMSDIVMAAVRQDGDALKYASDELKADKDVVMAAIQQDAGVIEYASTELQADRDVIMAAIQQDGLALMYASTEMKNDKDVVLVAVSNDGHALQDASDELRADKEVVMTAVANNKYVLKYASHELQADMDIVRAACISEDTPPFLERRFYLMDRADLGDNPVYQFIGKYSHTISDEQWPTVKDYLMAEANQDLLSTFDRPDDIHALVQSQLMGDIQEVELPYIDFDFDMLASAGEVEAFELPADLLAECSSENTDYETALTHAQEASQAQKSQDRDR